MRMTAVTAALLCLGQHAYCQVPLVDSGGTVFFGFQMGGRLPASTRLLLDCMSGRAFATSGGRYDIVTDDVLFRSPHEHSDSAAVLAALDSVTVCVGRPERPAGYVLVALVDSVIVKLGFSWADSAGSPAYDSLIAPLTARFGAPGEVRPTGTTWEPDSLAIDVTRNAWWIPGRPQVYVTSGAGCDRYEQMVHRREPALHWADARTDSCWHHAPLRPGRQP